MRYLIARLGDPSPTVTMAAVRALDRLGEPAAVMPLYELVQSEATDPTARRAAAEALVKFGLLRRQRTGPSLIFMWVAGIAVVIVAVGAAQSLGPWAVLLFLLGVGALGAYALLQRRRGDETVYIGPNGERIRLHGPRTGVDDGDSGPWPEFDGLDL